MPIPPPPDWIAELEDQTMASMYETSTGITGRHPEYRKVEAGELNSGPCAQCDHGHRMYACACGCPALPSHRPRQYPEGLPL